MTEPPPDIGITCSAGQVRLTLAGPELAEIVRRGQGAIWYDDCQVREGAKYIGAWYQDGVVIVAFHIEHHMPMASRRLALAPISYVFVRDPASRLSPLDVVNVSIPGSTPIIFTLYEVTSVIRPDEVN